jgi:integrase
MTLTNVAIQNSKPRDKAFKVSDGGGLHLLVQPNGSKLWRIAFRVGGQQKLLSLGPFPSLTLAEAREQREKVKRVLRDGGDPAEIKREQKRAAAQAQANTFRLVAQDYLKRRREEGASPLTLEKGEWLIEKVFGSSFVDRPIHSLKPAEIAEVLLRIDASGRYETARRARTFIGSVFRHGNRTFRVEGDPSSLLRGVLPRHEEHHFAAITDKAQFGALLDSIDAYDGWPSIRLALKIAALSFQRPGEIRGAKWSEVDLPAAVWRIPAERMKKKRAHDVPLSRQVIETFTEAHKVSGHCELVFPQIRSFHRPISENSMNSALRRMGYTKEEHTAHGFRASAHTLLSEAGFRDKVIDKQLAHIEPNEVRRAYNRAEYWEERVQMMQAWADMLDRFRVM